MGAAAGMHYPEIEEKIRQISPDIVGITTPTPAFAQVLTVCEITKKVSPEIITVLGGPHPTALPDETTAEKNVDVSVLYEGEVTFLELAEAQSAAAQSGHRHYPPG